MPPDPCSEPVADHFNAEPALPRAWNPPGPAGIPTSPYVRMAAVADMLSMVASHLDPSEWLTVNVDLDLHTFRDPVGEWIGLRGLHKNVGDGIGLSEAVLYDLEGRIGRGTATILIDRR